MQVTNGIAKWVLVTGLILVTNKYFWSHLYNTAAKAMTLMQFFPSIYTPPGGENK